MVADDEMIKSALAVAAFGVTALTAWVGYLQFKSSRRQRQQELDAAAKAQTQDNRLRETELGQESLVAALARADIERERQDQRITGLVTEVRELKKAFVDEKTECSRRLDLLVAQLKAADISPDPGAMIR